MNEQNPYYRNGNASPGVPNPSTDPYTQNSTNSNYQAAYGVQHNPDPAQNHGSYVPPQTPEPHISAQPSASSYTNPGGATPPAGATSSTRSAGTTSTSATTPSSSATHPVDSMPTNVNVTGGQQVAKSNSSAKTFLIAFLGALVACVIAFGAYGAIGAFNSSSSSSNVVLGAQNSGTVEAVAEEATLAEAVAEKCLPSVVSINVYSTASSGTGSIFDYLYGYSQNNSSEGSLEQSGIGSGVVISEDGYVITNNHVVEGGAQFEVVVDGEIYSAELVGTDSSSDVAVLKLDGSGFNPISIGDSDNISIGEWVMSIGSPFGLEQSVATGIISATSRSQIIDSTSSDPYSMSSGTSEPILYPNLIQTDAAINPGNSGGALVDAGGNLIGINTLITSYSGNYSGVGFAIPVNYAISIAQDLIAGNEPTHAQLGVNLTTVNSQTAERYALSTNQGALVSSVVEGSPAAKAGIQVGDIIVAFDGKKVTSASDLMLDVRTKKPGDTVSITVDRDGVEMEISATLGESVATSSSSSQQGQSNNGSSNSLNDLFGNQLQR